MRILMLTCNNSLQDGINRHVLAIAPALAGMEGCDVAVCTTYASGEFNRALNEARVKTYALNLPNGHSLRTWGRFRRVLRDFRPDVIHAHTMGIMERMYLGFFRPDIPVVRTCHGITDFESGVRSRTVRDCLEALLDALLPGKARLIVYISRGVARAKGCPNGVVVYNPMRFEDNPVQRGTNSLRRELSLHRDALVIGTACRISAPKNPDALVRVMCEVLRELPMAHAVVCGDSQDTGLMQRLCGQVANSGASGRFHWLGYRANAPEITGELDCFVMTSVTEGMPTALLEAMFSRTPIAFMRGQGGLVDLALMHDCEGPIAAVAEQGDCSGLAAQVVNLLNDKKLAARNAARAFEVGRRYFEVSAIARRLVSVYKEVL